MLHIEQPAYEELHDVYVFAERFKHSDNFYSILHTGITYVIKSDNIIVGTVSLLRQDNHWNFTIFNFDLLPIFQNKNNYHFIIEYILKDIKRSGGYTIEILKNITNEEFSKALLSQGFKEYADELYILYRIDQNILF